MKKRIHVNQHNMKHNRKYLRRFWKPPFTVKTYKGNTRGYRVRIASEPPVELVYSPDKPLSCGATAWIETEAEIDVDGSPSSVL